MRLLSPPAVLAALSIAAAGSLPATPSNTRLATQYRQVLMLERELPVRPGGTLVVDVPDGDVEVLTGPAGPASVRVYTGARDLEWGRSVFERMRFDIRVTDNTLRVTASNPRVRDDEWRRNYGVSVRIAVQIPAVFNAEIVTRDGDIELGNLEGRAELRSSDGDVRLSRIKGPEIAVHTADGDIRARALDAQSVDLRTNDGDVEVHEVSGALNVSSGDGDIRVYLAAPNLVRLRTRDGDISIYASRELRANLDLYGEDLDLSSAFRVEGGRVTKRGVVGTINGGGPLLEARTNEGTIALRRR